MSCSYGWPWLKAKDVPIIFRYNDTKKAIINNVDDDENGILNGPEGQGGFEIPLDLNESLCIDLWKQEKSKTKYKWVCSEALPCTWTYEAYITKRKG